MKILVIEDTQKHQDSAKETLSGHEVTVAKSYDEAMEIMAKAQKQSRFPFEVVLTDMMMPESHKIALEKHCDQVPYGFAIALNASLRGAKFVAMVTDGNHHKDAMTATLDHLVKYNQSDFEKKAIITFMPNFVINGAKAMFIHNAPLDKDGRKNWGKVLADLTALTP